MSKFAEAVRILRFWVEKQPPGLVELVERPDHLTIRPLVPDSFEVTVYDDGDDLVITTERWHTHVDDPIAAASTAFWLFTPYTRLVHELNGDAPWASWIESYSEDKWIPNEPIFLQDPRMDESWKAAPGSSFTRVSQQQSILSWAKPIEEIRPGIVLDADGLPTPSHIGTLTETSDTSSAPRGWEPR